MKSVSFYATRQDHPMFVIGIYGDSKFYKLTPVSFSQFTCK